MGMNSEERFISAVRDGRNAMHYDLKDLAGKRLVCIDSGRSMGLVTGVGSNSVELDGGPGAIKEMGLRIGFYRVEEADE